jgi:hypothetical protein
MLPHVKQHIDGFWWIEVLTAVTKKSSVFWDITSCSLVEFADISEENTPSIFRVEEEPKQSMNQKQAVKSFLQNVYQILPDYTASRLR